MRQNSNLTVWNHGAKRISTPERFRSMFVCVFFFFVDFTYFLLFQTKGSTFGECVDMVVTVLCAT